MPNTVCNHMSHFPPTDSAVIIAQRMSHYTASTCLHTGGIMLTSNEVYLTCTSVEEKLMFKCLNISFSLAFSCLKRRGPLKQTEGEWTNVLSVIFKIRFLHHHLSQLATVQRLTILPKRQHLPWVTAMFLRCCNAQTINDEDVFVL